MGADLYDVLGVTSDADVTQIKRHYRQLVRQHHPDTQPPELRDRAHQQMLAINQAWTTLSDPAARARYDLSQRIVIHPPQSNFPASNTRASSTRSTSQTSYQPPASSSGARTSTQSRPTTSRAANTARTASSPRRSGDTRSRLLTQVFEAAELYFFHGRVGEAIGVCRRVLQQDPNNAEAHALMGDMYADQGRLDVAVFHYEQAVRSQPANVLYRKKWQSLSGQATPDFATRNGGAPDYSAPDYSAPDFGTPDFGSARDVMHGAEVRDVTQRDVTQRDVSQRARQKATAATVAAPSSTRSATYLYAVWRTASGLLLLVVAAVLVLMGHLFPGAMTASWPPAAPISGGLLFALCSGVGMLGAALPLLDQLEPCGTRESKSSPVAGAPTLLVVALAGLAFAPLAACFAVWLSLATRRANLSLFSCLALSVLLSVTLALPSRDTNLVPSLHDALLWWSGRAVFPVLLAGWALGSLWPKQK